MLSLEDIPQRSDQKRRASKLFETPQQQFYDLFTNPYFLKIRHHQAHGANSQHTQKFSQSQEQEDLNVQEASSHNYTYAIFLVSLLVVITSATVLAALYAPYNMPTAINTIVNNLTPLVKDVIMGVEYATGGLVLIGMAYTGSQLCHKKPMLNSSAIQHGKCIKQHIGDEPLNNPNMQHLKKNSSVKEFNTTLYPNLRDSEIDAMSHILSSLALDNNLDSILDSPNSVLVDKPQYTTSDANASGINPQVIESDIESDEYYSGIIYI